MGGGGVPLYKFFNLVVVAVVVGGVACVGVVMTAPRLAARGATE